jgi:hypothetical protein
MSQNLPDCERRNMPRYSKLLPLFNGYFSPTLLIGLKLCCQPLICGFDRCIHFCWQVLVCADGDAWNHPCSWIGLSVGYRNVCCELSSPGNYPGRFSRNPPKRLRALQISHPVPSETAMDKLGKCGDRGARFCL